MVEISGRKRDGTASTPNVLITLQYLDADSSIHRLLLEDWQRHSASIQCMGFVGVRFFIATMLWLQDE